MNENKFSKKQEIESLRLTLVGAGYNMANSQRESMEEDEECWGEYMIEGKINPWCIDISDQAAHAFYSNELDGWVEVDEETFPKGCGEWGVLGLIDEYGMNDNEVFGLLHEGAANYINDIYGEGWKDNFPEPIRK